MNRRPLGLRLVHGGLRGVVICAVSVVTAGSVSMQSKRALAELGRMTPPPYAEPLLRVGEPAPVFEDAIRAYGQKRYAETVDLLRRFAAAEPDDPAGNFYLAVSLMMIDEVGEAEDRAGAVLAAGQTPFARAAHFVLAKAAIRLGKLDIAERELTEVAAGADRFALDAAGVLPRVKALTKRK